MFAAKCVLTANDKTIEGYLRLAHMLRESKEWIGRTNGKTEGV